MRTASRTFPAPRQGMHRCPDSGQHLHRSRASWSRFSMPWPGTSIGCASGPWLPCCLLLVYVLVPRSGKHSGASVLRYHRPLQYGARLFPPSLAGSRRNKQDGADSTLATACIGLGHEPVRSLLPRQPSLPTHAEAGNIASRVPGSHQRVGSPCSRTGKEYSQSIQAESSPFGGGSSTPSGSAQGEEDRTSQVRSVSLKVGSRECHRA